MPTVPENPAATISSESRAQPMLQAGLQNVWRSAPHHRRACPIRERYRIASGLKLRKIELCLYTSPQLVRVNVLFGHPYRWSNAGRFREVVLGNSRTVPQHTGDHAQRLNPITSIRNDDIVTFFHISPKGERAHDVSLMSVGVWVLLRLPFGANLVVFIKPLIRPINVFTPPKVGSNCCPDHSEFCLLRHASCRALP
jgi:hypothetical protein